MLRPSIQSQKNPRHTRTDGIISSNASRLGSKRLRLSEHLAALLNDIFALKADADTNANADQVSKRE
jgi:hypothetical protein